MMLEFPILSLLVALPMVGAGMVLMTPGKEKKQRDTNARYVAMWTAVMTFGLSWVLLQGFDPAAGMQFVEDTPWIRNLNIHYHLGVDGISVLFVALTALLTPLCLVVSWNSVTKHVRAYLAAFLALEALVIGVFCALDFVLFYFFWEAMLIPMFIIIGIWGGEQRVYATMKFFLYTLLGSVLMLVAMVYMYLHTGTFDIQELAQYGFAPEVQKWLFLALFAAFAVKVPMWPFHTWLPDAHVQAPTAGSVILAGILLKMGAYGFLRFSLPMFPDATLYFTPMVMVLSVIAIVATALVALRQTDMKKLIAYSSVSHMGFVTLGIFAGTEMAVQGAVMQMINHGIVSAALFMLVGVVYDRLHTREIKNLGGLVQPMPVYAGIFMLFTMAAVGLPGSNNFIGEFMILAGSYPVVQWATVLATVGVVLGAAYMLLLYKNAIFGVPSRDEVRVLADLTWREKLMFVPLIALTLWLGVQPNVVLDITAPAVDELVHTRMPPYGFLNPTDEPIDEVNEAQ